MTHPGKAATDALSGPEDLMRREGQSPTFSAICVARLDTIICKQITEPKILINPSQITACAAKVVSQLKCLYELPQLRKKYALPNKITQFRSI